MLKQSCLPQQLMQTRMVGKEPTAIITIPLHMRYFQDEDKKLWEVINFKASLLLLLPSNFTHHLISPGKPLRHFELNFLFLSTDVEHYPPAVHDNCLVDENFGSRICNC